MSEVEAKLLVFRVRLSSPELGLKNCHCIVWRKKEGFSCTYIVLQWKEGLSTRKGFDNDFVLFCIGFFSYLFADAKESSVWALEFNGVIFTSQKIFQKLKVIGSMVARADLQLPKLILVRADVEHDTSFEWFKCIPDFIITLYKYIWIFMFIWNKCNASFFSKSQVLTLCCIAVTIVYVWPEFRF